MGDGRGTVQAPSPSVMLVFAGRAMDEDVGRMGFGAGGRAGRGRNHRIGDRRISAYDAPRKGGVAVNGHVSRRIMKIYVSRIQRVVMAHPKMRVHGTRN